MGHIDCTPKYITDITMLKENCNKLGYEFSIKQSVTVPLSVIIRINTMTDCHYFELLSNGNYQYSNKALSTEGSFDELFTLMIEKIIPVKD